MLIIALTFAGCSTSNAVSLKCVSMSNQEYIARPAIMNINSSEPSCK